MFNQSGLIECIKKSANTEVVPATRPVCDRRKKLQVRSHIYARQDSEHQIIAENIEEYPGPHSLANVFRFLIGFD
jgi:hypothetical protein